MTKKASGVYYTPSPVVDYIVRGTLGPLLAGKSPMQLAGRTENWEKVEAAHPLTVLDPACGSGHFLLGAYQFLLDWCCTWYREHNAARWLSGSRPTLCRAGQSFDLRNEERERILREHIFGVDIDEQAIEIAKQSLRSKTSADASERAAAGCLENIRCGNSLIGSDFHAKAHKARGGHAAPLIDTFDWEVEFPAVMAAGGFDAIVGNPPYVNARLVLQEQGEAVKRYYRGRYRCARRAFDLYVLFVERSHELLRDGGRAGLIVPNKIATLDYARPCRELLLTETTLDTITDVSDQRLFHDASVYPYIITWTKQRPAADHCVRIVSAAEAEDLSRVDSSRRVRQRAWSAEGGLAIHDSLDVEARVATQPLGQRASIHSGTTGFSAERMACALQEQPAAGDTDAFEFIVSGNIDRYAISLGNVRFMKRVFTRPVLPMDSALLTENKSNLFVNPKIVIAGMTRRLEAAFDGGGLALGVQVYAISDLQDDPRFLLGLLNSKLMSFLLRTRFQAKRLAGGYLAINKGQLAQLPIRMVDAADRDALGMREAVIESVERTQRLRRQLSDARSRELASESVRLIAEADQAIDLLVYKLYRLTEREIQLVTREIPTQRREERKKQSRHGAKTQS